MYDMFPSLYLLSLFFIEKTKTKRNKENNQVKGERNWGGGIHTK